MASMGSLVCREDHTVNTTMHATVMTGASSHAHLSLGGAVGERTEACGGSEGSGHWQTGQWVGRPYLLWSGCSREVVRSFVVGGVIMWRRGGLNTREGGGERAVRSVCVQCMRMLATREEVTKWPAQLVRTHISFQLCCCGSWVRGRWGRWGEEGRGSGGCE